MALAALAAQPRPFRASPLPLSTMEPRYRQQEEQREARRQAAHDERRRQLLEQQRPFGFEERAAERQQRLQLLQGSGPESPLAAAAAGHPATPTFRAQPVPVSTTEVRRWVDGARIAGPSAAPSRGPQAKFLLVLPSPLQARYALLAAELQLQHHRRPATAVAGAAAAQPSCRPASPTRRPATAAARWWLEGSLGRGSRVQPMEDVGPCTVQPCQSTSPGGSEAGSNAEQAAKAAPAGQPTTSAAVVGAAAVAAEPSDGAPLASLASTATAGTAVQAGAAGSSDAQPTLEDAGEPQYSQEWEGSLDAAGSEEHLPPAGPAPVEGSLGGPNAASRDEASLLSAEASSGIAEGSKLR